MTEKDLENLRGRADAKLHDARIHFEQLRGLPPIGGDAFDFAHHYSFLYHLVGAKEAFVGELNVYYGANLAAEDLSLGKLWNDLKAQGLTSPEVAELYSLESDQASWLSIAKRMRDYTTHVGPVARDYRITPGGKPDRVVSLRHPDEKNLVIPGHLLDVFAEWLLNMTSLLERLRRTAIAANKEGLGLE